MPMSSYYRGIRDKVGTIPLFNPSVAAIIRNGHGDILFQRPQGSVHVWSLPAGSIELGETPAVAVVREVHEETGLKIQPTSIRAVLGGANFRYTYADGNTVEYVIIVFACEILSGELQCLDGESAELRYFPAHCRPALALPYPDDVFLKEDGAAWFEGCDRMVGH